MTAPPPYPRIPHLDASARADRGDEVLGGSKSAAFLLEPVVVEEKLDGANVMLWLDNDQTVQVSGRAGPGAMDRGRQLGPLRAWVSTRGERLTPLLEDGSILYAEWLWRSHGVHYDRLPDYLVGLDLGRSDGGFADLGERDRRLRLAAVTSPPRLFTGVLETLPRLQALLTRSTWSTAEAEGAVVRRLDPSADPRVAKFVTPTFRQRSDEAWRAAPVRNRAAIGA